MSELFIAMSATNDSSVTEGVECSTKVCHEARTILFTLLVFLLCNFLILSGIELFSLVLSAQVRQETRLVLLPVLASAVLVFRLISQPLPDEPG